MLRSDPDVLLVSEIRSPKMATICHQAALTGHLVLTALHCQDAAHTLRRMMDLKVPPFVIAEAVSLVVAQRLMRRVCPRCSRPAKLSVSDLDRAKLIAAEGGLEWSNLPHEWKQVVGCTECRQLGYRGRLAVNEMLPMEGAIQTAVTAEASLEQLKHAARDSGCTSLGAEMIRRAARGETTLDEALRMAATLRE